MFEPQTRPIDQWPREFTPKRERAEFTKNYQTLMRDLEREVTHLKSKSVLLLLALEESDIRLDGRPRADARPKHPGVILVVETPDKGTLRFPCDRYDSWTANLRAITLHLDALRRIDRYGVSVHGEQYTGWQKLAAPGDLEIYSLEEAKAFLRRIIGGRVDTLPQADALREAEKLTHPDAPTGNSDLFKRVQNCRKHLLPA